MHIKIISGKYKGKKISLPQTKTTRPTKQIVRESFINTIKSYLRESVFVEVFAGSGSVGIEALSNGAKFAYFIEKDFNAIAVLKKNLSSIEQVNTKIICGNSFEKIQEIVFDLKKKKEKAIFYLDPPFNIRQNQQNIYEQTIKLINFIPKEIVTLIVIEHLSSFSFDAQISCYQKTKSKKFGKTTLSYFV